MKNKRPEIYPHVTRAAIRHHERLMREAVSYPDGAFSKVIFDTATKHAEEKGEEYTLVKEWDVPDLIVDAFKAGAIWYQKKFGR